MIAKSRAWREEAISKLKEAFWSVFESDATVRQKAMVQTGWSVLDEKQWLFVIVSEADWTAHEGNVLVRALVHRTGDANAVVGTERTYTFSKDEFRRLELRNPERPDRNVYWAVHNMTGAALVSNPWVQARKALEDWQKLYGDTPPQQ
jgi:hypothetical protein